MPGKCLYVMKLALSILCLVLVFSPLMQAESYPLPSSCIDTAPAGDKDSVFQAMLNSFELYSSFFNDIDLEEGYRVPRHGRTREVAIQYLSAGFADELAIAIVDEYTLVIPELDCLVIRSCGGLPIITNDDSPFMNYRKLNNQHVSLSRIYKNCYSPEDCFRYQIQMKVYAGHWKISALSLDELRK